MRAKFHCGHGQESDTGDDGSVECNGERMAALGEATSQRVIEPRQYSGSEGNNASQNRPRRQQRTILQMNHDHDTENGEQNPQAAQRRDLFVQ